MKAAILKKTKTLTITNVSKPSSPPPGFVKVKVKSVGLCGSDIHYFEKGAIGDFKLNNPLILGHEVGGIITEVGEGVNHKVGSTVSLELGIPCEECQYCMTGNYNLCKDISFFATPPTDGAMTEYLIHPAKYTFAAGNLNPAEASLAEPLSVGIFSVRCSKIELCDKVAVLGAGPVGLLTAFVAKLRGANVYIFDIKQDRIAIAKQLGFDATIFNESLVTTYDAVIDCTGNQKALKWGQKNTRTGGSMVLVGMGETEEMKLDGLDIVLRGIKVYGSFRYENTYPEALEIIQSYRDEFSVFTENKINLEELPEYLANGIYKKYFKTIINI